MRVSRTAGVPGARIRRPAPAGPRISPFTRLARVQAISAAGDGCLAVALAVSVFFGLSPTAARPKVLLFLLVTFIPFVVVAPMIGPLVDRVAGGRRLVMQVVALLRALSLLLMAFHLDDVLLYPIAFAALVLQKTQSISKSALVPSVVRHESDLVEANSKLGLVSGVFGFLGAAAAGVAKAIAGVEGCLIVGSVLFIGAFVMATLLPSEVVAAKKATAAERAELRSAGITLAASAMALMRASVGFCFFLLAFWLRSKEAGRALVGLSIAMVTVGVMIGNAIAPTVRKRIHEEPIFIGALGLTAAAGIGATLLGGVVSGVLLALGVNFAAALARLAFDSIVQRDAPDANHGRAFAQFETKFQLAWVLGGLPAVLFTPPGEVGFAIVGLIALFSAVTYVIGMRSVRAGKAVPETISKRARRRMVAEVERRKARREATPTRGAHRPLPPPQPDSRASRQDPPLTRRP
ncbi:unannotated protein [freshwater metagenome]|uniref:Unannotated protein n=1 Tax=freshwater metagenome TaxID=449393 RepID=A0A6J7ERD8_9ZZZZ